MQLLSELAAAYEAQYAVHRAMCWACQPNGCGGLFRMGNLLIKAEVDGCRREK